MIIKCPWLSATNDKQMISENWIRPCWKFLLCFALLKLVPRKRIFFTEPEYTGKSNKENHVYFVSRNSLLKERAFTE